MVKTDIIIGLKYNTNDLREAISSSLGFPSCEIGEVLILKRELLVSGLDRPSYKMTVAFDASADREAGLLKMRKKVFLYEPFLYSAPKYSGKSRPIVVGAGPAGLFAALILAESGAHPIVLERGLPVDLRTQKVSLFMKLGVLDTECNIQFGEGGAGAYSDGKLKFGSPDKYKIKVLSELCSAGAPSEIMFSKSAHVGTDKLPSVVSNLREKIISLGGEFIYSARVTDIKIKDGRVYSVIYDSLGESIELLADNVIIAAGHSARDVYKMLIRIGATLVPKSFGIGVRIEHPREYINELVYGKGYDSSLESASYHLVTHLENGRSVYSFCMCPGGSVVAAASEEGGVVTNGMSPYARNLDNSNAAFLVSVNPEDFGSDNILGGIELQEKIEKRAFSLGGGEFSAPVFDMGSFSNKKKTASSMINPSYERGVKEVSPDEYLPSFITDSLRASLSDFDSWMRGFYLPEATLTGAETRSTAPVRVLREDSFMSVGIDGLYPAGEGAGYAGGIVSSAVDGIRCAEALILRGK